MGVHTGTHAVYTFAHTQARYKLRPGPQHIHRHICLLMPRTSSQAFRETENREAKRQKMNGVAKGVSGKEN